jgi:hypothetical protein
VALVTLSGSTLSGNSAGLGGGVEVEGSSSATVSNSTFSGNTALPGDGGGIQTYACGSAVLSYVTFAANTIALAPSCSNVSVIGSIVAGSTSGTNCTGPIADRGDNLDSGTTCGLTQPGDQSNTDPLLGPLAGNGGPTPTMALLPGSPAIDHGGTRLTGCPAGDQRGASRADREDGQLGQCDIGAYESSGIQ